MPAPAGFSLAAAFTGSFLAVTVTHALALPAASGLMLVALVVVLCSSNATSHATLGVAVLGWLFLTGFVTNSLGELHIDGPQDGWRLILLVGLAATSGAASRSGIHTSSHVGGAIPARQSASRVLGLSSRRLDRITDGGTLLRGAPDRSTGANVHRATAPAPRRPDASS